MGIHGLKNVHTSVKSLLKQQAFDRVCEILELTSPTLEDQNDWQTFLDLLRCIPKTYLLDSLTAGFLFSKALIYNHCFTELFEFTDDVVVTHGKVHAAPILVLRALGLHEMQSFAESRMILEDVISYLKGEMLGVAWTRLGTTCFQLNEPWQDAFHKARELLTGVELGRALLNEGACLSENKQNAEARNTWLEALSHFKSHPKLLAWTRYNLGISALQDLEPEAEHHFLEGVRLTKNPKAASMQAAILNGLGASRRVLGEWHRAEFSYRQALQIASDLSDREESHLGLARTLRLSGRPTEALETLELALHIYDTETPIVNVARSMAFLALNDAKHAKIALERVGTLVSVSDQWLYRVASAELARREGRLTDAVDLLEGMPVQTLHMREEVRMFPKLFELLSLAEKPVPVPLEYIPKTIVRVLAQGVLRVFINDRKLELAPTGRPAELLVFLLEQGGMASLERLMDAFFPDANSSADQNRARKAIWKFSDQLRHALGWQNAVQALRGAYMLDQDAIWQYDITEARAVGVFQGEFFKGVYSSWAIETAQSLEGLSGQYDFKRTLN